MGRIALTPGTVVEMSGLQFVFERELAEECLSFSQLPTYAPWLVTDDVGQARLPNWNDLENAIAAGDFKIANGPQEGPKAANHKDLDPEDIADLDPQAAVRAYYVRQWDAAQVGTGKGELSRLITRVQNEPDAAAFEWVPSVSSLRRWIIERGEIGQRRLADMVSQSGRQSKKYPYAAQVNRALLSTVIWYWSLKSRTITDASARLRRIIRTLNRIRNRHGQSPHKCPCAETVRRYIRDEERYETWVTKFGKRAADSKWRPTGKSLSANNILQLALLDHTTLDDICVFDAKNCLPMGRPYLVVIIDAFSRCILSWLITFEPPQIWTVGEAIKRANRPKPWLSERFPKMPTGASIYGKVNELVVDNAWENTGRSMKDSLADLGISLTFAPIHTPTYKSFVERFFGTLNSLAVHKLPGAIAVDIETQRLLGLDPSKDAILTIEQVEELVEEAINLYHHDIHETLNAAPALVWKKAAHAGVNILRDDTLLAKTLGVVGHANLDRRGIKFSHLWYKDQDVVRRVLDNNFKGTPILGRRKKSASVRVKFKYDPANLGHIHIFDPTDLSYSSMPAEHRDYAEGRSLYQHHLVRDLAKQENEEFFSEEDMLAALQSLRTRIEAAAPDLRVRARRAAMRLFKDPARQAVLNGDTVSLIQAGKDASGQIVVPNSDLVSKRRDRGAAVPSASAGRKAKAKPPSQKLQGARDDAHSTSNSFQDARSDEDFLNDLGW